MIWNLLRRSFHHRKWMKCVHVGPPTIFPLLSAQKLPQVDPPFRPALPWPAIIILEWLLFTQPCCSTRSSRSCEAICIRSCFFFSCKRHLNHVFPCRRNIHLNSEHRGLNEHWMDFSWCTRHLWLFRSQGGTASSCSQCIFKLWTLLWFCICSVYSKKPQTFK